MKLYGHPTALSALRQIIQLNAIGKDTTTNITSSNHYQMKPMGITVSGQIEIPTFFLRDKDFHQRFLRNSPLIPFHI